MKKEEGEEIHKITWVENYTGISAEIEGGFLLSCNSNLENILSMFSRCPDDNPSVENV